MSGVARSLVLIMVTALSNSLFVGAAVAHETNTELVPAAPGLRIDAALATFYASSDQAWPTRAMPGVLTDGAAYQDQRDRLVLEHGTFGLAGRLNDTVGAFASMGWHDGDSAHIESAGLLARFEREDYKWDLIAGRRRVGLGRTIDRAADLDAFAQVPLALRAVLNDDWTDDGLTLGWYGVDRNGLREARFGLHRGRAFPGGNEGPLVPAVQVTAGFNAYQFEFFAAHFEPDGRGAEFSTTGTEGHTHGMPDCNSLSLQTICFDGRSELVGLAASWQPEFSPWRVEIAGLIRQDRGQLYSTSGEADYRGTFQGGWIGLSRQHTARLLLATRIERLTTDHELNGVGTALLARDGGLSGAVPVERIAASFQYEFVEAVTLGLEAGREMSGNTSNNYALIRLILAGSFFRGF